MSKKAHAYLSYGGRDDGKTYIADLHKYEKGYIPGQSGRDSLPGVAVPSGTERCSKHLSSMRPHIFGLCAVQMIAKSMITLPQGALRGIVPNKPDLGNPHHIFTGVRGDGGLNATTSFICLCKPLP